jgi:hypothetical protein
MDGPQPLAAGVVQRRRLHLVEQLADHVADPHHLGRLLDHVGHRPRLPVGLLDHLARLRRTLHRHGLRVTT